MAKNKEIKRKDIQQIASEYEASSEKLEELNAKGLEKLFQHRRAAKWLEPLEEEQLQEVLREAQMLCLHLLEETENEEK